MESYFIQVQFAIKTNVFFSPATSSMRPAQTEERNRERASAFFDFKVREEGGDSGSNEEEHEEPTAEDFQFIAGYKEEDEAEVSTPLEHRRVDAAIIQQEAESIMAYFPWAFTISEEQPLQFDFNLFLLELLTLPQQRGKRIGGNQRCWCDSLLH